MRTDKASNTYVRAPGTTHGHAAIETVMDHLAHDLGLDPLELRMINMIGADKDHPIRDIVAKLKTSSNFDARREEITAFNKVCVCLEYKLI